MSRPDGPHAERASSGGEQMAARIAEIVAAAPPLNDARRDRLRGLLIEPAPAPERPGDAA